MHMKTRREMVWLGTMAAGAAAAGQLSSETRANEDIAEKMGAAAKDDARWRQTWDAALEVLAGNVRHVPRYDRPVLFEGAVYPGIWQECGPHEGLV